MINCNKGCNDILKKISLHPLTKFALAETDISSADHTKRNPSLVLHLLTAIARTNVTSAKLSTITADVQSRFGSATSGMRAILYFVDKSSSILL